MEKLLNRRSFLQASVLAPLGMGMAASAWGAAAAVGDTSRRMGAFLGAAVADAIGGPVEIMHAARIRKYFGWVEGPMKYRPKPEGMMNLHPGYALQDLPGSFTDDTYIRIDLAKFLIDNSYPWTPDQMAAWILENGNLDNWWGQAVKILRRIEAGEFPAEEGGLHHVQGGGGAWWTPVSMVFAGDPKRAAKEARTLCRIWKAPLEQDILGAVCAGTAEALREGASWESVADTVIQMSGKGRTYFERAAEVAESARSPDDLILKIYAHCLYRYRKNDDGEYVPEQIVPVVYAEDVYTSIAFVEQQPLALAAFVYGQGDPRTSILQAVNGGRDADSIASNVGGWCGALHGEEGLPKAWVDTVLSANAPFVDLRELGEKICAIKT